MVLSDVKVIYIWKRCSWIFMKNLSKNVSPNIGFLRELSMPQSYIAYLAMHVLDRKATWKRCQEAYKRWGWSDNHIVSAFRRDPRCMILSEKKLMATMDFLVNKMGLESQAVAELPDILSYSLEKRIIPRFSVVRVLLSKGLIEEENLSFSYVAKTAEKYFLSAYLTKYLDEVPQLSNVYQGKVDLCTL
ncbi:uncharacterized protein LOC126805541 [Argentina anserina]|uniref:uncharacterized protein LOC126805541 n=1 Tax=Argentina anserina TaxID=57926 RepID=UPI0021762FA1|nr:uncharacterized protein LOC126805541 [Potentilla anserina]